MHTRDILISGASIAGPALAWWLRRYGFSPTVVERAPALRGGGFAVDFRGEAHMGVLTCMGRDSGRGPPDADQHGRAGRRRR